MKQYTTVAEFRAALDHERAAGRSVGMVGTSGALHEGHLSLVRRSSAENDVTAMFWGGALAFDWMDDEIAYQRDFERDLALAEAAGLDAVYLPDATDLFRRPPLTTVSLPAMSSGAPGLEEPGHLDTIVMMMAKLFNIFGACRSYFGEKDWQQLAMFKRMAEDLCWPVDVVGCETVRDPDGVAVSSRNAQLTREERERAPALYRALLAAHAAVEKGERSQAALYRLVSEHVNAVGSLEYFVAVNAETMEMLDPLAGDVRLLGSMGLGSVRLVDNVGVGVDDG